MRKPVAAFAALLLTFSFSSAFSACENERVDENVDGTAGLEYSEVVENKKITGYEVSGIGEASAEELVIPSAYRGKPVVGIAEFAFGGCEITSVTIPDSVKTIGEKAFYECSALEYVNFGGGVVSSGKFAFGRCPELKRVNVTDIANWCAVDFANLSANPLYFAQEFYLGGELVTDLKIPDNTARISSYAFYECPDIKSVETGDGAVSIGDEAFFNCTGLERVVIGDGVTSIGECAFQNCYLLGEVTFGESLSSIGDYAFSGCAQITGISMPASLKSIGESAFSECYSLTGVDFEYGLETIGKAAFAGCTALKGFSMPDSVTEIGFGMLMFGQGGGFVSGELENDFSELVISNSLTEIPDYAFNGCNIKTLKIGDKVQTIRYSAFYACSMLESVILPVSLKTIQSYSFYRCPLLNNVYYEGTAEQWASVSIGRNGNELRNICFYSENRPEEEGNFWHYVNGEPELW